MRLARLSALVLLAGCAPGAGVDPTGVPLRMVTAGIGDIVLAPDHVLLDDGSRLTVQRLAEGVYALPTRPVRLLNGTDFCSGQPVAFLTLHRTEDGLVVMNAGDWAAAPEPPPADTAARRPSTSPRGTAFRRAGGLRDAGHARPPWRRWSVRELVQRHNRRLYRVARAILADDSDAEDTVQETWLRAFRRLDGFRGQSGFATWVTRYRGERGTAATSRRRRTPTGRIPVNGPGPHDADVITLPGAHTSDPEGAAARR